MTVGWLIWNGLTLFRVSPFLATTAREVGARIQNGGY